MDTVVALSSDDLEQLAFLVAEKLLPTAPALDPADSLLTESEAAAFFRVRPHVLRDARKRGELDFHKIGKAVRYDREQLNRWKRMPKSRRIATTPRPSFD